MVHVLGDDDALPLDVALKPLPMPKEWATRGRLTDTALREGAFRLLNQVKDQIGPCAVNTWTAEHRQLIVPLMGAIFAFYSHQKSGKVYDNVRSAKDYDINKMDVVTEPHSIQATSILRLLGWDAVGTVEVSCTNAQLGDGLKLAGTRTCFSAQ